MNCRTLLEFFQFIFSLFSFHFAVIIVPIPSTRLNRSAAIAIKFDQNRFLYSYSWPFMAYLTVSFQLCGMRIGYYLILDIHGLQLSKYQNRLWLIEGYFLVISSSFWILMSAKGTQITHTHTTERLKCGTRNVVVRNAWNTKTEKWSTKKIIYRHWKVSENLWVRW